MFVNHLQIPYTWSREPHQWLPSRKNCQCIKLDELTNQNLYQYELNLHDNYLAQTSMFRKSSTIKTPFFIFYNSNLTLQITYMFFWNPPTAFDRAPSLPMQQSKRLRIKRPIRFRRERPLLLFLLKTKKPASPLSPSLGITVVGLTPVVAMDVLSPMFSFEMVGLDDDNLESTPNSDVGFVVLLKLTLNMDAILFVVSSVLSVTGCWSS